MVTSTDLLRSEKESYRYAELTCRSHYSFLRGASRPEDLVARAAQFNLSGLAITDRNGVYGIPKAYRAWQQLDPSIRSRFRLIIGAELTHRPSSEIENPQLGPDSTILLAKTRGAYGLLCRFITAAHAEKEKGQAALSLPLLREHLKRFLENPAQKISARELLWILPPPFRLNDSDGHEWLKRTELLLEADEHLNRSVVFPVFQFLDGHDSHRIQVAEELAHRFGEARLFAANDVHFHSVEQRPLQDVLTAIRQNQRILESGFSLFSNAERHLKSPSEMRALFHAWPELVTRAHELAQEMRFDPGELRYRYPSEWIPEGHSAQSYLRELTWQGAINRYGSAEAITSATRQQLEHELKLIDTLGFADYFLTIWEIVAFARSRDILCQGRGSAANSAVCYCLGITAIDPVRMNLLFERFISAERGEPPDIDVDFEHERREEVIQHVYEKYGRDRAGMVAALITYRGRSAFREVSRALGFNPDDPGSRQEAKSNPLVEKFSEIIQGTPRHLSIHSGGFTLSADPLIETVPIEPARMPGRTIVQWDKDDLDAMGLLKVDLLSLGMLSALQKTLKLTGRELHQIPAEDPATYRMMQKADTVGVFQIESRAQMSMLPRLLPKTFYDLVVELAIVRPGPIVGKMVHPYLRRKQGLEPVIFPDERLRPILGRTLGVPLFQEQIMKIAISLAQFTPGEADQLRRAIGAWRSSGSITEMGQKLMQGLLNQGLPQQFAEAIFEQIQGFAEYGFPESHAASFALLAYASAYLKCHHPAEFACSLINSQPMGFYANHTLIDDARRHGVAILPVDLECSEWDCTIERGALRLGFRLTRGMSLEEYQSILQARQARPFGSVEDFLSRTKIRRNVLHTLALGDAFAKFGQDPRATLWRILGSEITRAHTNTRIGEQLSLFGSPEFITTQRNAATPSFRAFDTLEAIQSDYRSFGASPRGHPMLEIRKKFPELPALTTIRAKSLRSFSRISIAGVIIVLQRPPTAKGTCFATLEDETGFLDLILKKDVYETYREELHHHSLFTVSGALQRNALLVDRVDPWG